MKRYCGECKRLEPKDRWDRFRIDHFDTWLKIIILSIIGIWICSIAFTASTAYTEVVKKQYLNEDTGEYYDKYHEGLFINEVGMAMSLAFWIPAMVLFFVGGIRYDWL